jgi:hypothetical protein
MRIRALAALGLLACGGLAGSPMMGCMADSPGPAASTAASIRQPLVPRGEMTPPPSPLDMPGGGRGSYDFTKSAKGKP